METRIQFRIDETTKNLAQQRAASQGTTLSDACRDLVNQLAEEQLKLNSHEEWLTEQVNQAFAKLDSGQSSFTDHDTAATIMAERKEAIRKKKNA